MVKTIEIPIQNNPIKQRHFCTVFNGAYLIHKDNCNPPSTYLEVYHNNKQVIAGLDWGIQSSGNRNSIYNNILITSDNTMIYAFVKMFDKVVIKILESTHQDTKKNAVI